MSIQSALLKLGVKLISGAQESDLRSTSIEGILEKIADKMPSSSGGPGAATTDTLGLVKQAASVAAAAGEAPTKAEFDGLITALKNAGIMADQ